MFAQMNFYTPDSGAGVALLFEALPSGIHNQVRGTKKVKETATFVLLGCYDGYIYRQLPSQQWTYCALAEPRANVFYW
jgi:hypothetical protein